VPDRIEIRRPTAIDEFQACHAVQQQAWTFPELLVVPYTQLMTISQHGGVVLCAFDRDQVVGFVYGFLGRRAAVPLYLFSQRLAVLPGYQGKGIGAALKWAQRSWALEQGLDLIVWTYDPLEVANARLNIAKLGAGACQYERDAYGQRHTYQGRDLPSDRLLVEWQLASERVLARLDPGWRPPGVGELLAQAGDPLNSVSWDSQGLPHGDPPDLSRGDSPALVEVPARWQALCEANMTLAREWRTNTRLAFEHYFGLGYTVTGCAQGVAGGHDRSIYRLERLE
jgi:predicted GNAT superfamily acetyltransferase